MLDATPTIPDVHQAEPIPEAARAEVERLLCSGDLFRYTAAADAPVTLLERAFADKLGSRFALAVSSCSAALFLAMKALDLPADSRVLIPAFTFAAVPSAVVHAGCVPVLAEVGDDLRLDMADARRKAVDVDAILVSHMRGHTSDMDALMALATERNVPLIEDAAHSLGTTWAGRPIGTLGRLGCFSFQSYKMLNGGEGGMIVTDDAELAARAIIMSGAYEQNWRKHDALDAACARWQNRLPLYNTRMSNLAAAVICPQIDALDTRVARGRHNHDHVAARLSRSPHITVPAALPSEERAPDSLQFLLEDLSEDDALAFAAACKTRGIGVQIFGLSEGNARAFWNWEFLDHVPDLPKTRAMLRRTCDLRLPARLRPDELDCVADIVLDAMATVRPSL